MQLSRVFLVLALVLVAGSSSAGIAPDSSAFDRILVDYEQIRLSLLHDSANGVADTAQRIRRLALSLEANVNDPTSGVVPGREDELHSVLPVIRTATADLIEAATIDEARKAFGSLSRAMVRYRRLVSSPAPVVVFCSMAEQIWLQPSGEIGNPYYGQSMPRCGEVVSE